ncbi:hypothetical protein GSI_13627 [Ganoderma sinense ZZ0214-1]|uniref:Uncharacterized protein n=1 Tax=Ganoderma sinense ZZ0214-1 TaxID=1077348 RepID=A0A2G8RQT5_9APHY|nr:hypothetical protein GSI_13627 [Ganoderma sinense ZZ0214-1]
MTTRERGMMGSGETEMLRGSDNGLDRGMRIGKDAKGNGHVSGKRIESDKSASGRGSGTKTGDMVATGRVKLSLNANGCRECRGRRLVAWLPEQSPAPSRVRSPAPVSPARRAPATALPAASRAGSPLYKATILSPSLATLLVHVGIRRLETMTGTEGNHLSVGAAALTALGVKSFDKFCRFPCGQSPSYPYLHVPSSAICCTLTEIEGPHTLVGDLVRRLPVLATTITSRHLTGALLRAFKRVQIFLPSLIGFVAAQVVKQGSKKPLHLFLHPLLPPLRLNQECLFRSSLRTRQSQASPPISKLTMHVENEYLKIAKNTRKALNDLMIADIDLKNAESRRAVSSAQLEKARAGKLGIDFIAGS